MITLIHPSLDQFDTIYRKKAQRAKLTNLVNETWETRIYVT